MSKVLNAVLSHDLDNTVEMGVLLNMLLTSGEDEYVVVLQVVLFLRGIAPFYLLLEDREHEIVTRVTKW